MSQKVFTLASGEFSMKNIYSIPIAIVALVVFTPLSAMADTWGDQINDPSRFIVLPGYAFQAVLDNETGLVWERSPLRQAAPNWAVALDFCNGRVVNNRFGWRLPTLQE